MVSGEKGEKAKHEQDEAKKEQGNNRTEPRWSEKEMKKKKHETAGENTRTEKRRGEKQAKRVPE